MALGYLISPALQLEDINGKPLTGGYLNVYVHGTTNRAVTYKDYSGNLNPNDIVLNGKGMAVIIADSGRTYDVYCYDRNGVEQWSRLNVCTIGSGSGGGGGEELSVLRCDAADLSTSGSFVFDTLSQYGEGAYVDQNGTVRLAKGTWHYDITVEVDYSPLQETAETTNLVLYTTLNRECSDFDLSYAHTGTLQLSGIAVVKEDGAPLVFGMGGMATGMTASVADFSVFEVATSGGGSWEYYEAGEGISINENVISVDTGTVQEKLVAGDGIDITDNVISVDGTFTQQQADWAQTDPSAVDYIKNKPTIPSGSQLVPEATQSDVGEVLTVNSQGTPEWAPAQAPISAGDGVDITNNVVSAKVDGTTVTFNASGELVATASAQQVQSDWAQSDSSAVDYIKHKPNLSIYATQTDLTTGLATKQDVISDLATIRAGAEAGATAVQDAHYHHTDNNYTDADVAKLSGIEAGAEVNVRANWTESDTTSDAYIQNKPANLVQDPNYVHTDNNYTDADVAKLAGIAAGAEVNVQADWAETNTASDTYIANKPANLVQDANYVHTDENFTSAEKTKLAGIATGAEVNVQSDWNETDPASDAYILNKPTIPVIGTITV